MSLTACCSALLAFSTSACHSKKVDQGDVVFAAPKHVAEKPPEPPPARVYDETGELVASSVKASGLSIPEGFTMMLDTEREHVFSTPVSIEKVERFFGPRLLTGRVTPIGHGVIFEQATVKEAVGSAVKVDVSITPGSDGLVIVRVQELEPPPLHPPSPEEVEKMMREMQKTAH